MIREAVNMIYHVDCKIILKQCMPFLRFKNDETLVAGHECLDVKLPFGEMQVMQENADLINRYIGIEKLEILFITDESAHNKSGSYVSVLR